MAAIVRLRGAGAAAREAAERCPPADSLRGFGSSYVAMLAWMRTLEVPVATKADLRLVRSALQLTLFVATRTSARRCLRPGICSSFEEAYGKAAAELRELFDAAYELGPEGRQGEAGQGPGQDSANLGRVVHAVRGEGGIQVWAAAPPFSCWLPDLRPAHSHSESVPNRLCIGLYCLYCLIGPLPDPGRPHGRAAGEARL